MKSGIELIADERKRQVECEGWTAEHDDGHDGRELAWAAACYAAPEPVFQMYEHANGFTFQDPWPWDEEWDKRLHDGNCLVIEHDPKKRIRLLTMAGALIAAEIDRLNRLPGETKER